MKLRTEVEGRLIGVYVTRLNSYIHIMDCTGTSEDYRIREASTDELRMLQKHIGDDVVMSVDYNLSFKKRKMPKG